MTVRHFACLILIKMFARIIMLLKVHLKWLNIDLCFNSRINNFYLDDGKCGFKIKLSYSGMQNKVWIMINVCWISGVPFKSTSQQYKSYKITQILVVALV